MAIPTGTPTSSSTISALVQTAYDQYVRMALRSIPVMRSLADVKPVQQAMPGSSVVFSIYSDLAQATSTLTETSDVSSIALGNPSQVTVTLNEYGSAVTTTKKLNLTSFNDVDSALADIIAYNAADSIDNVVGQVLSAGTNVIYANGPSGTVPTASSGILPVDTMTVADIRNAVVSLRTNKALPRMGELYAAYLHPRQSADLRAETGTGGFQELTKYVERTPFVAGAVGVIEGAFIVETPRVLNGLKLAAGIATTTTITNVALTSNVVTITTGVAHGLGTGQVVAVAAVTATTVNSMLLQLQQLHQLHSVTLRQQATLHLLLTQVLLHLPTTTAQSSLVVKHWLKHRLQTSQPLSVQRLTHSVVSAQSVGTTSEALHAFVKSALVRIESAATNG